MGLHQVLQRTRLGEIWCDRAIVSPAIQRPAKDAIMTAPSRVSSVEDSARRFAASVHGRLHVLYTPHGHWVCTRRGPSNAVSPGRKPKALINSAPCTPQVSPRARVRCIPGRQVRGSQPCQDLCAVDPSNMRRSLSGTDAAPSGSSSLSTCASRPQFISRPFCLGACTCTRATTTDDRRQAHCGGTHCNKTGLEVTC